MTHLYKELMKRAHANVVVAQTPAIDRLLEQINKCVPEAGFEIVEVGAKMILRDRDQRAYTGTTSQENMFRFLGGFAAGIGFCRRNQNLLKQANSVPASESTAASQETEQVNAAVLAVAVADGVDDAFTGEDGVYYARLDFSDDVRKQLQEQGFERSLSHVGVVIVFQDGEFSDDVNAAAFTYFDNTTEYEGEWAKTETAAGGRVPEQDTEDNDTEDGSDDGDDDEAVDDSEDAEEERTQEDDEADNQVLAFIDSDNCPEPDDYAESDAGDEYSLFLMNGEFLDNLKKFPATADYVDGMVGIVYWYGKEEGQEDFSESCTWYTDEDVMRADWAEITGAE